MDRLAWVNKKSKAYGMIKQFKFKALENPIDIAFAIKHLRDDGMSSTEIADALHIDRGSVIQYSRLIFLPPHVWEYVQHGFISFSHARVIVSMAVSQRRKVTDLLLRRAGTLTIAGFIKWMEQRYGKRKRGERNQRINDWRLNTFPKELKRAMYGPH